MNPIVKVQLESFKKNNPMENFSDSDYFEVMSIFAVENGLFSENINPFDAHLKGNEFGIDGIAISIQGKLCTISSDAEDILSVIPNHESSFHFFQSKTSTSFDYGEMSKFFDAVYDFFTDLEILEGTQIEDLSSLKDTIYKYSLRTNPSLHLFYCTTGTNELSDVLKKLVEKNKTKLSDLSLFSDIQIHPIGAKDIQSGFRAATNSLSGEIYFPKTITMPEHEKVDQSYIGYITASEILKIACKQEAPEECKEINRSIFYDNVRDFNPDSDINKSIIDEIKIAKNESSFVYRNNGITIVAKNISRKNDQFTIEDYQIVNGCQTTNILSLLDNDKLKNIKVPLKLIGCSDTDFVSSIIVSTNKQNAVKDDQFWALLPFMKDLEEFCAAQEGDKLILIERRENQYRDTSVEKTRIFKPGDLIKAVAAMYFFEPNRAARDYRGIKKDFENKIFLPGHEIKLYHLAAFAAYKFDYYIRNNKIDRSLGIYKYYVLFSLVRCFYKDKKIFDSSKKTKQKLINNIEDILDNSEKFIDHIRNVSKTLIDITTSSHTDMKINREKIRDFIRRDTTLEKFINSMFSKK